MQKLSAVLVISLLCLTPILAAGLAPATALTNPSAPADISVGTSVLAANPERFGANLEIFDYIAWNTNATTFNIRNGDPGMEPIVLRYKGTATSGGAYTFQRGGQYAIFVLSRQLTLTTPTTLHLPVAPGPLATLYTLTGDPRASNITTTHIAIQQQALTNFTKDYAFDLPPGSVYLFVSRPPQSVYLPVIVR